MGATLVLALIVLLTLRDDTRRRVLALLVGVSGGLLAVQIAQVHLFTIVVVLWALFSGRTARSWTPPEVVLPLAAAALLSSTVLYGSLVNSPTLALQFLALASSACLIVLCGSRDAMSLMLYGLLGITSASSVWGLMQVAGVAPIDAWHLDVSAIGRPIGFYPEPDWLGMYSGIGLILAWRLKLKRWARVLLIVVNLSAWVLAFARAAWIAVAASSAVAFLVFFLTRWKSDRPRDPSASRPKSGRTLAVMVAMALGVLAFEMIPTLHDNLLVRLSRTFTVQDSDVSAQARVLQNDGLAYLAGIAPWNGLGLSASGRVGVSGRLNLSGESDNNVASNWLMGLWVDGGWLALPTIATFILAAGLAVKTVQGQALILVLLSSFFSNATFQPIAWMLLGMCLWYILDQRVSKTQDSADTWRAGRTPVRGT